MKNLPILRGAHVGAEVPRRTVDRVLCWRCGIERTKTYRTQDSGLCKDCSRWFGFFQGEEPPGARR